MNIIKDMKLYNRKVQECLDIFSVGKKLPNNEFNPAISPKKAPLSIYSKNTSFSYKKV